MERKARRLDHDRKEAYQDKDEHTRSILVPSLSGLLSLRYRVQVALACMAGSRSECNANPFGSRSGFDRVSA